MTNTAGLVTNTIVRVTNSTGVIRCFMVVELFYTNPVFCPKLVF
jgi:hypothetical protein